MDWRPRREKFRALMKSDTCIHPASIYDPISARIAEHLEFEVGIFSGSVASLTVLGAPDLLVLTLSEFAEQVYRINRAAQIPLLVDADHGYGNALNVRRTVEELETVGVAALTIEDTDLPQPFGTLGSIKLLNLDEGVGKIKAALSARADASLMVAGRTSAITTLGLDEAILRGKAYEAEGVDAMFYTGVSDKTEIEALSAALNIPIFLGGSGEGILADTGYLIGQNVRVSLQGHQSFRAAVQAVYTTLKLLREGTAPSHIPGQPTESLMTALTDDDQYQDWMREFLGPKTTPQREL